MGRLPPGVRSPWFLLAVQQAKGCTKYSRDMIGNLESVGMKKPPCASGGVVVAYAVVVESSCGMITSVGV